MMAALEANDSFEDLARYYDAIMSDVDYDRWEIAAANIAQMLPKGFIHLDAACGTGTLLRALKPYKWRSFGVDLSPAMLRLANKKRTRAPLAAANLQHLPFDGAIDYITCLFDSMNFLLKKAAVRRSIKSFAKALAPGGVLYFDIVTEEMILQHFADQTWTERNGRFSTKWSCEYHRATRTCETRIQVKRGPETTLYERVYEVDFIKQAIEDAGLTLLGVHDAETWRPVRKKSVRIDFVCTKGPADPYRKAFKKAAARMQRCLAD
jgi:SAM-dependent methyltransferase